MFKRRIACLNFHYEFFFNIRIVGGKIVFIAKLLKVPPCCNSILNDPVSISEFM